ncbi:arginyltransferase [Burkholderiaceae bacterium DAT-1]|nr:arginyltransferase [Burkholderiaceae bacterium DAT-1]
MRLSHPNDHRVIRLQFYATAPYPCSYLDDRMARSQVAIPSELIDSHVYSDLVRNGFRRSGMFTYRPWCDRCRACVPVRLDAANIRMNRTQRRMLRQHQTLEARIMPLGFEESHYQLYRKYQAVRHAGGGMDGDSREQYENFILSSHVDSFLVAFHEGDDLKMVSLIDRLDDGLSSVYTFFEPDDSSRSYGTYNILWQVQHAQALGLPWVYLGYWIEECRKMSYKTSFQPLEGMIEGKWQTIDRMHVERD